MAYPIAADRYRDRNVLITGGANGLGSATATRLAEEGAGIGLIDLDAGSLEAAAAKLAEMGHDVATHPLDVTDVDRAREAVVEFAERRGSIDGLVTAAGIYPWVEFTEMTIDTWRQVLDVNLAGTFTCAQAAMGLMKEQGYGRIVTISSGTVHLGMPGQSAYIASKAGVVGFTRVLAREGGPFGVTANCILPGLMATDHVLRMRDDVEQFFELVVADQSVKRRGKPEDIADASAYLCSEGASFVTGQSLLVSGGDRFV